MIGFLEKGILMEFWKIGTIFMSKVVKVTQELHSMRRKEQAKGRKKIHWLSSSGGKIFRVETCDPRHTVYTVLRNIITKVHTAICYMCTAFLGGTVSDSTLYLACLDHELMKFPALPLHVLLHSHKCCTKVFYFDLLLWTGDKPCWP